MVGMRGIASGALLIALANSWAGPFPAYRIGDVAEADVITPVPLIVVDHAATRALKEREANRPALLVRFQVGAAADVESGFLESIANLRSNFLVAMKAAYPLTKVTARNLPSKRFLELTNRFQREHAHFPLDPATVRIWALGGDHAAVFQPLARELRAVMERPLLPDTFSEVLKAGERVHLIYGPGDEGSSGLGQREHNGWLVSPSNLVTLSRARQNFVDAFLAEERPRAVFAASFLRENCHIEPVPSAPTRGQPLQPLYAADRYAEGELVVKRGQMIDDRALAALALLREKTALGDLQRDAASAQSEARRASRQTGWLLAGVVALSGAFALLTAYLWRRRQPLALVPVRMGNTDKLLLVPETTVPLTPVPDGAAARAGFAAQLARVLGSSVVQRLFSLRAGLIQTQRLAAQEVTELEQRLEQVHAPLRERLQAYEQRIADLEKQLAQRGAENRELLKAKIDLTRRHLEAERVRQGVEFN